MGKKRKRSHKTTALEDSPPNKQQRTSTGTYEHPVLSRYYRRVITLRQFLLEELPSSSKARRRRVISVGKRNETGKVDTNISTLDGSNNSGIDLAHFLESTLVGILNDASPAVIEARQKEFLAFTQSEERSLLCTDTGPCNLQSEIVDYVISNLFNRHQKPQHVLANGFHRTSRKYIDRGIGAMSYSIPGIVSTFPNHHVTALKTAPWTDILGLLGSNGEDIMSKLLIDCGLFSCVDEQKAVFHQISGIYLSELELLENETASCRDQKSGSLGSKSNNDTCTKRTSTKPADVLHKPNSITFVRRRMLYARPAINSKGEVRFGLRHIHVLNRFPNHNNLEETVRVMMYIFPRQFGLHNAFTSVVDSRETVQPFKDYTVREEEIARLEERQGSRHIQRTPKIPKRLRGRPLQLVQKMQKRNQTCSYTELLRHYCPLSETGPSKFAPLPCSPSDESSQQLVTQISLESQSKAENVQPPPGRKTSHELPSTNKRTANISRKVCLLDYATPTSSVSAFCRAVLQKLIPREFFGESEDGLSNQRMMMTQVDRFIRISRFESLSLHEVCKGFKVTCLRWLEPPTCPTTSDDQRISLSDLRKRTEILHEFVYYIFDSLLIPLIRTNFYVTESQVHRNKLFYFRHDIWRRLIENPIIDMKTSMFTEIKRDKVNRVLGSKRLSWSAIRLLPKAAGTRPIINLRRRVAKYYGNHAILGASTNSTLKPVFNMLSYEKERNPELLGSSMFSVSDMYPRLKSFKNRLIQIENETNRNRQLFFVKLDIKSCFDTIPQQSLVSLIESLVTQPEYHITKHVELRPGDDSVASNNLQRKQATQKPMPKPIRRFYSKAKGLSEIYNPPVTAAGGVKNLRRNTIEVDTASANNHQVNTLLKLLEEHVQDNLVKIGKKYFRQKNGIPQGSVLSSLLCNFFYGKLEREVLHFLAGDDALLLRLIDDFLLITTCSELANQFLQVMMDGQPAYGITVNANKSLVNFEATIDGTKMPRLVGSTLFPYCGNLIDTHTLDICKDRDYGCDGQVNVANTLTVELSRLPGQAFHRKVLFFFRLQTHTMFLDTEHSSLRSVLLGIYSSFVETAIKMYRYIQTLPPRLRPSQELVLRTIRDVIQFANKMIQSKRKQPKISQITTSTTPAESKTIELMFKCAVSHTQIEYLGLVAFRHILGRKQTNFITTLRGLRQVLNRSKPQTNKETIRIRWVIREGNKLFDNWKY